MPNKTDLESHHRRGWPGILLAVSIMLALVGSASPAAGDDGGPILGTEGRLLRVSVEVEAGLDLVGTSPDDAVFDILSDGRSWIGGGDVRFQIVEPTATGIDVRVRIASPAVVDQRCLPLRTGGRLSCRNGRSLNINADRWNGATDFWTAGLDTYRAYLINHEIGHYLGYGHQQCPGAGQLAPVMQQQTKSLQGCIENGWPDPTRPAEQILAPGIESGFSQRFQPIERATALFNRVIRSLRAGAIGN